MIKECSHMPENISNIVIIAVFVGICVLASFCIFVKILKNRWAPVRTVNAVVIDKHKVETFSKYSGNGKREKYVVVFSAEGRKLSFYVSGFSYEGYRRNEKGILKYKGNRIIAFR